MKELTPNTEENRLAAFKLIETALKQHRKWYDAGIRAGIHRNWIHSGYVTNLARRLTKQPHLTFESIPHRLTTDQIDALHSLISKRIHNIQTPKTNHQP